MAKTPVECRKIIHSRGTPKSIIRRMAMKTLTRSQKQSGVWKTASCIGLSLFYFALLAYPFGVTAGGFMVERMLIAGVILFALSIPVWIINLKREFFTPMEESTHVAEEVAESVAEKKVYKVTDLGQLALINNWITPSELKQILFCQEYDKKKFGEVAVKRNFLTMSQVKALLQMQSEQRSTVDVKS
jgi:hypothetical protein